MKPVASAASRIRIWKRQRANRLRPVSASLLGRSHGRQLVQKRRYPPAYLVADLADLFDALAGGIRKHPVQVSLARIDGAGVAAAHRHDDVRRPHELVRQRLGELLAQVEADLTHRLDD